MRTSLGKHNNFLLWHAKAISAGIAIGRAKAMANAAPVGPSVQELRSAGYSFSAIANELKACRIPTARGGKWCAAQVQRILRWTT
ncbi:recombinase family protein [Methylobacterium nodulans]|uniref:recombinase family protein n=1 Tax=Methylobacterium nodulans TaxID=114616 RepID=UPI000A041631|nr:recombinase family protein [Methylobacterium nodulans]